MIDERVRAVMARLEERDAEEWKRDLPLDQRSLQVEATTGRVLFALAASRPGCSILELGGSRGYSTLWLAAGARLSGGRVLSVEQEAEKCREWRVSIADAGLEQWAELHEGDALELLPALGSGFHLVFLDAWKVLYEPLFQGVRPLLAPGSLVVADNVTSHAELAAYSAARQADPALSSVTVPMDSGLELSLVLPA